MGFLHVLAGLINLSTVALTERNRLQWKWCHMDVSEIKCSDDFTRQGEGICSGTRCDDEFLYFTDRSNKGTNATKTNQYHPYFRVRYRYDKTARSLELDNLRSFEFFSGPSSYLPVYDNSGFVKKVLAQLLVSLSPKVNGPRTVILRTEVRPEFEHQSTEYPKRVANQMIGLLDEQKQIYIRRATKFERCRYCALDQDQIETFTICMTGEKIDCKCEDKNKSEKQCEADKSKKCDCYPDA